MQVEESINVNETHEIHVIPDSYQENAEIVKLLPKETHRESFFGAVFNFANSTIGNGLLATPFVLKECGLVLGLVLLLLGGILSGITLTMEHIANLKMKDIDPSKRDYFDIGEYCAGKLVGIWVKICIIAINFGACISYLVALGDLLIPVFQLLLGDNHWFVSGVLGRFLITLIFATPLILLSMIRRVADLQISSFISLGGLLIFTIFMGVSFFAGWTKEDRIGKLVLAKFDSGTIKSLGIIVFAFACHTNLCSIANDFKKESTYKVRWAIVCEIIVCFALYSIAASFGYLSFLDNTKGNIADSYGTGWTNAIFRIVFAIAVICAFPMCCYPCRLSLDGLIMEFYHGMRKLFGYDEKSTTVPSAYESLMEDENLSFWKRIEKKFCSTESIESIRSIIETLIIGYGSFLLAVFFPKIEIVFSLTGSTASAFTAIIFPAWFFIKLSGFGWFDVRITIAILILLFGIFFGIFGTGVTIYGLFGK